MTFWDIFFTRLSYFETNLNRAYYDRLNLWEEIQWNNKMLKSYFQLFRYYGRDNIVASLWKTLQNHFFHWLSARSHGTFDHGNKSEFLHWHQNFKHIAVKTKWPLFCRRYIQISFPQLTLFYLESDFTEVCYCSGSNSQYSERYCFTEAPAIASD